MALHRNPDGTIDLREGRGDVFGTLALRFGSNPSPAPDRVGGSVMLLSWAHERDGVRYATMATAGMERIPFEGVGPFELVCEVLEEQIGAAAVALHIVVQRAVEELGAPWKVGQVWINDQPILKGTGIVGLVVGPDPDGAHLVDETGRPSGNLQRVWLLTEAEAHAVARAGLESLERGWQNFRSLLGDVERTQDVMLLQQHEEELPYPPMPKAGRGSGPQRPDGELAQIPVAAFKMLAEHPVRWIECNDGGRFVAFTQLEKPEELQVAENFEVWTMERLLTRNPWLRDWAITAQSGDYASYGDNEGWLVGRLE